MARAAVKAKQAQAARAQAVAKPRGRGHASGGNPNQDLFFSRIRRRQKWVFMVLAVIFAVSFAALGVGSGSGSGLEQMFSGLLGTGSDPVAKAQAEIKTNKAKGYKDLASAYITKGDTLNAIDAMKSYLQVKPKDADSWTVLGGYQRNQGNVFAGQYQQILQSEQIEAPGSAIKPSGKFGSALGTSPLDDYYLKQLQGQTSGPYASAQTQYNESLTSYENAAKYTQGTKLEKAAAWYAVYTAASYAGKQDIGLKALQQYVNLYPANPNLKSIEGACKSLGYICKPGQKAPQKIKTTPAKK
jgi:tetratricopeptide (TPR) repeat protein